MTMTFRKATKFESKLKLAFIGPSGSGKTYSALAVGCALAELTSVRVAVLDTERGSASLYADLFPFDVLELESFSPATYVDAIKAAEKAGYGVIIIDSLSHAWTGKDGALEQVDRHARRNQGEGNSFGAWRHVTPLHNAMVDAVVSSTSHVIVTMRAKTEYVQEKNDRGKTVIRKVGLAPIQRDGLEYEFSVVGDIDQDHGFSVTKTRCNVLADAYIEKPGRQLAETLVGWLRGEARPAPVAAPQAPASDARVPTSTAASVPSPPPARAAASAPPQFGAADLLSRISSAATLDDLRALYSEATALPKGTPERAAVARAYAERKVQIDQAAAEAERLAQEAEALEELAAREAAAAAPASAEAPQDEPDALDEVAA
jgi:hypothetical protein